MDIEKLPELTAPGRKVHLVGIGGVSMSALAEELTARGAVVSGSDIRESETTCRLAARGIKIFIGHSAENLSDAQCVIRTAAAHDDNPEIAAARRAGIPVFERAQAWGAIMREYTTALCISGTHGKSTATSMATHIAMKAGLDPTVMIGGDLPLIGGGHRVGKGGMIIAESCEYCNSFLSFYPTIAVVLNIDEDHLDFFSGIEEIKRSFRSFAERVPAGGTVILNADDPNTMDAMAGLDRRVVTVGTGENADIRVENIGMLRGMCSFELMGESIQLKVPGTHNVLNAAAAAVAAMQAGASLSDAKAGLEEYGGLRRRFEYKGGIAGATVYDDYAHHPSEVKATLTAARQMGFERVRVLFQPHTYTRTRLLFDDFVKSLSLADEPILLDIYAAREKNTIGVSSAELVESIPGASYMPSFEAAADYLLKTARPGELILTMGAGDVYKVGEMILNGGKMR